MSLLRLFPVVALGGLLAGCLTNEGPTARVGDHAAPVAWATHKPTRFSYVVVEYQPFMGYSWHSVRANRDSVETVWELRGYGPAHGLIATDSTELTGNLGGYSIDSLLARYAGDFMAEWGLRGPMSIHFDSTYGYLSSVTWADTTMADVAGGVSIWRFQVLEP